MTPVRFVGLILWFCLSSCARGGECPGRQTRCDNVCVDTFSDVANCGGCWHACQGTDICDGAGQCVDRCGAQVDCPGAGCIDPLTDPIFCGASGDCVGDNRGVPCVGDQMCSNGQCVCQVDFTPCGTGCVDTRINDQHCGGCDRPCGPGLECIGDGTCDTACAGTTIHCGGACVDPQTHPAYCGAGPNCFTDPGVACDPTFVCVGGACVCPGNQIVCSGVCVDPQTDESHCGAGPDCAVNPGTACAANEFCINGTCVVSSCGDSVVQTQAGEENDPPPGPSTSVPLDPVTCRYNFSALPQLYCNGSCGNWNNGPQNCEQTDADAFCKLKTDNPLSTATSFTVAIATAEPGVCCPPPTWSPGTGGCVNLGVLSTRGVVTNVAVHDTSIFATHGSGQVVRDVVCTNP